MFPHHSHSEFKLKKTFVKRTLIGCSVSKTLADLLIITLNTEPRAKQGVPDRRSFEQTLPSLSVGRNLFSWTETYVSTNLSKVSMHNTNSISGNICYNMLSMGRLLSAPPDGLPAMQCCVIIMQARCRLSMFTRMHRYE